MGNKMSGEKQMAADQAAFDQYAANYDRELGRGLAWTGEGKDFYAEGRIQWLRRTLGEIGVPIPRRVFDYGCGTGSSAPWLLHELGCESYLGYDPSAESIAQARKVHGSSSAQFTHELGEVPPGAFDLVFCNGVFHHIPVADRVAAVAAIFRALKPGGLFALWENNKWNPAVHWIMSKVPFDHDAIMLFPGEAKQLLRGAGFEIIGRDFQFVFPGMLSFARFMEPALRKLPLGGQYQVLARRPASKS
jgi:SAM-dependent methyltransferase